MERKCKPTSKRHKTTKEEQNYYKKTQTDHGETQNHYKDKQINRKKTTTNNSKHSAFLSFWMSSSYVQRYWGPFCMPRGTFTKEGGSSKQESEVSNL